MDFLKPHETAVFALGGLNEIGKNCYCVEHKDELLIIDAGIKFPDDSLFGVDYVIPDYSYLIKNQEKIAALVITHGHEDHIGGIPFLLKQVPVKKIYAGRLAAGLIRNKLEEHRLLRKVELIEITESDVLKFKHLSVSFFTTTHSIPDSYGLAVKTPNGTIVETGDFRFDFTPIGEPANLTKMAEIGARGVTMLMSDSTNSEVPNFTLSERKVGKSIKSIFHKASGRVIVATFSSNVHRVSQIIEASLQDGRKIAIFGRSMENAIRLSQELGHIVVPENTFISEREINQLPSDEVTIICTGSQGEALAALSRIANGTHRQVSIIPGDTVIFSSSPIPGNVNSVNRVINLLYRAGAHVVHGKLNNVHTSGHASQEEQKLMLQLIKPKYFTPMHGEYRMLKLHAQLAMDCGVPEENNFIIKNGDVLAMNCGRVRHAGEIPTGDVYVDGNSIGGIGNVVIHDRKTLAESGLLLAVATVDLKSRTVLSGPTIVSRGFVYVNESGSLIYNAERLVRERLKETFASNKKNITFTDLKQSFTDDLKKFILDQTGREPMILPVIMDIND
ncbi:MAG: ribonuclease J1 [Culicoidibacterales bacterium]